MRRLRLRHTLVVLGFAGLAGIALAAQSATQPGGVTVHEWGTFTSVAGQDGKPIEWLPLSGPSDLPCFVYTMPQSPKGWYPGGVLGTPATVRMETPVLYFYATEPATLRVRVRFPQGLITEWFPDATVVPLYGPKSLSEVTATAEWAVNVLPKATTPFLTEPGESHYYAARATDASPIQAAGFSEKFVFYRGVASFPVPLAARVGDGGRIEIENTSAHAMPNLVLFERRGTKFGYHIATGPRGMTTIEAPALNGTIEGLRMDLVRMLTGQGLYLREAEAMVETWRDSWFEEGTRLFYVLPQAAVDAILPLEIEPRPAAVARAFVGRIEIVTPVMEADVETALAKGDLRTLHKYGRVLTPIAKRVLARQPAQLATVDVASLLRQVAAAYQPEVPCR